MSKQQVRLASLLLEEAFGDQVEAVGTYLLKNGGSNLGEISKGTGLQINKVMSVSDCLVSLHCSTLKVKKCLVVLIQHQLVLFEPHSSGKYVLYSVSVESVQLRGRFPRYILASRELYGQIGELICEYILHQGRTLMSQVGTFHSYISSYFIDFVNERFLKHENVNTSHKNYNRYQTQNTLLFNGINYCFF